MKLFTEDCIKALRAFIDLQTVGDQSVHYVISFTVLAFIAGAGYFAGFKDFYLLNLSGRSWYQKKRKKRGCKKIIKDRKDMHLFL